MISGSATWSVDMDNYWQAMAKIVASKSKAKRLQVGAIIAKDDRICSTGYNGMPRGLTNECEENNVTKQEVVHAELNAILFAARNGISTDGADIHITHAPCRGCAGAIIQSGIKRVFYGEAYRDTFGIDLLTEAGIEVEQTL